VPAEVSIRPYEAADRDAVWALMQRTPMPDGSLPTSSEMPPELRDIPANFAAFWVAVAGPQVVGTVAVQDVVHHLAAVPLPSFLDRAPPPARLRRLDVAPEHQRRGVGRRLTQTAVDWARDQGYSRVVLDTTTLQQPAVALYESMGFRRAGETRFQRWQLIWFELDLA
jgi:GNAT superfamily N-acetyltransferase